MSEQEGKTVGELEWEGWLAHPTTIFLRKLARGRIEGIKDAWANGEMEEPKKNWESIGAIKALQLLEDLEYNEVMAELGEKE